MAGKRKKLKLFLMLIILVVLGITASVFVHYRRSSEETEKVVTNLADDATLKVGRVRQTQTKDGKKEWFLDAESVKYANTNKEAVFKNLAVTFYLEDEKEVSIQADKGVLKTQKQDFQVSGNVVVKNDLYKLKTENLNYQHKDRFFSTQTPVEVSGAPFNLKADSMSLDLNTKISKFEGNVRGVFDGKLLFH